jgi:hypothetical protein
MSAKAGVLSLVCCRVVICCLPPLLTIAGSYQMSMSIEIPSPHGYRTKVLPHSLRTKFVNPVTTKVISTQPAAMWSHR